MRFQVEGTCTLNGKLKTEASLLPVLYPHLRPSGSSDREVQRGDAATWPLNLGSKGLPPRNVTALGP